MNADQIPPAKNLFLKATFISSITVCATVCFALSAVAQNGIQESSTLPAAPSSTILARQNSSFPPLGEPLNLGERFRLELHNSFGPSAFLVPATEAAITMAAPPNNYPHDWSDGGGAFGRNYGAELARHSTAGLTHFAVAAMDREDPRYYPSRARNPVKRFINALAFTLVDRSDSGHRAIAVSNLAGATAGGFIGMAIYPDGFNDTTHAYQRSAVEMTNFAAHNEISEFSPEIVRVLHKLHFPDKIADSFLPGEAQITPVKQSSPAPANP